VPSSASERVEVTRSGTTCRSGSQTHRATQRSRCAHPVEYGHRDYTSPRPAWCQDGHDEPQGIFKVAREAAYAGVLSRYVDFVLSLCSQRKYQRKEPPAARKAPRSSRAAGRPPLFALRAPAPPARTPAVRPSLGEPQGGGRQHQWHGAICLWMRSASNRPVTNRPRPPDCPFPLVTCVRSSRIPTPADPGSGGRAAFPGRHFLVRFSETKGAGGVSVLW
jgi:hypothetical protein